LISLDNIYSAHKRIKPFIHNTAVLTSARINVLSGASLFFKCENFQKSGSFKIRGAANTILQLKKPELKKGIVTASSGNHGAAVSSIATKLGYSSTIVMPRNTAKVKVENVLRNGGNIIWCEPDQASRDETLKDILSNTNKALVHPYDDDRIIAGQATVVLELLEQETDLDIIIVPVSGGGLLSGSLSTSKQIKKKIKVYGAEPYGADDAYRSLISGKIEDNVITDTICDGLRAKLGLKTFPIIKENIDSIIRVRDKDIINAMRLSWECLKVIMEPSCAITLAVIFKNKSLFKNKKVGLVISGGNVDLGDLPWKSENVTQ